MPTINLPKKKVDYHHKHSSKSDNLNHQAVYNTDTWRKLRLEYLKQNPLCKDCLALGKYISAIEVHHIIPISTADTIQDKQALGFDAGNLKGLCEKHHKLVHKYK